MSQINGREDESSNASGRDSVLKICLRESCDFFLGVTSFMILNTSRTCRRLSSSTVIEHLGRRLSIGISR